MLTSNKQPIPPVSVVVDMTALVGPVQRNEAAQRELTPADAGVHVRQRRGPVAELKLSKSSTPVFLQLHPGHDRQLPLHLSTLHLLQPPLLALSLRQLDRNVFRVLLAPPHTWQRAVEPLELDVPSGLPRFVNVATLKAMVGAGSRDLVFRKAPEAERWETCPDEYAVDLHDRKQVFKIREWAILS